MFRSTRRPINPRTAIQLSRAILFEPLESRRLLSGSPAGEWGGSGFGHHGGGHLGETITFSQAPAVVQTGLNSLATADGLTDPAATQPVVLGNTNGVETYTVTLNGTGTASTLKVDQLGDPVTAPTQTTTTWAALDGTGAGSDPAAAAEITSIATALSLTGPASTGEVVVSTASTGAVTYMVRLSPSSETLDPGFFGFNISVDAAGNPVGDQQLPFSVIPTAIQNALNAHVPTGATALAGTSAQNVSVQTTDGVVTYSTNYTATGVQTTVTVNSAGVLTSLPATTTTTFSALSSTVQTELSTLADADGVTAAIAANQSISVLTETNGTVIYSVTLPATGTGYNGSTCTFDVTVSSDASGNPTTVPDNGGIGGGDAGHFGHHHFGHDHFNWGDSTNSSTGTTINASSGVTNASGSVVSLPVGTVLPADIVSASDSSTFSVLAKLLPASIDGLTLLGGDFAEFAPATLSTAIISDLTTLVTDGTKLLSDTTALTKPQKAMLKTDTKAIATALKAMGSTLAPLEATLKSDAKISAKTLKADAAAVKKDKKNPTALSAAEAKLSADQSAALAVIVKDAEPILSAVQTNAGVDAAYARFATDLPTIAADTSAVDAAVSQFVTDL